MFIECPACYARKYILELPPHSKLYHCHQCRTALIYVHPDDTANREKSGQRRIFGENGIVQRATLAAVIPLLFIIFGVASFTVINPASALAAPLKSVVAAVTQASSESVRLIEEARAVVASYERNIISQSLHSMRVIRNLSEVPPITVSTNDMANFPAPEYPLFPDYLDRRFSQFNYTVNSKGIIDIDTSSATTDFFLKKIDQLLTQLEGEEQTSPLSP